MDSEFVSPALTADTQGIDLYHMLGGMDTCRKLSIAFYAHVEYDRVLRPLYPPTLKGCPVEALADFLIQFYGGPCEYAQRRWSLSLYEAHLRFAIGQKERDAWLSNMLQAVEEVNIEEPARSAVRWFFAQASTFLINQPPAAVNTSVLSTKHPIGDQSETGISYIQQDVEELWQTQLTLEKMIAAFRQENADTVLLLLESPIVQAYFVRDRAAFLSFLALLSSSSHPLLLDYVRQALVSDLGLVRERYTSSRTLLHDVVGQGSLSIVQLLLQLGADPNARDQWGHTPLYFVGNASHGAYGADVVRALTQGGANVNAKERLKHCTALHMAARRGNVQVAEALLDCGADIEARDKLGDTPLHRAVKCGKAEMVAFLLSQGADIDAKGKDELTAWQIARGAAMKRLLHPPLEKEAASREGNSLE